MSAETVSQNWFFVGAFTALGIDRLMDAAIDGQWHRLAIGLLWLGAAAYFWRKK